MFEMEKVGKEKDKKLASLEESKKNKGDRIKVLQKSIATEQDSIEKKQKKLEDKQKPIKEATDVLNKAIKNLDRKAFSSIYAYL